MVSFPFDPDAPILLFPAEVVGPKRAHMIRLILDTGASYTMLHPDVLMTIGCELPAPARRRITTASGIELVSFVTLPALRCLGQTLQNVEICVHDLPSQLPAEGLLGLNFLRRFHLSLDFRAGTLQLQ